MVAAPRRSRICQILNKAAGPLDDEEVDNALPSFAVVYPSAAQPDIVFVPVWLQRAYRYMAGQVLEGAVPNDSPGEIADCPPLSFESPLAFVRRALEEAGLCPPRSPDPLSYLEWGTRLERPIPGALAVFCRRPSSDGLAGIGFVAGQDRFRNLLLLGLSPLLQVRLEPTAPARLLACCWPPGEALLAGGFLPVLEPVSRRPS